ncbi:MAG: 1-deoxy-D-xylulose-5-phosphate synthase [Bacteroidetes bacterium]|nr:1-deoxy-D-xylulose-5-phosphate synthase [Bacteroidota bacterium]MCL2303523.1 1-deoxy-D-xylulose-5-phosphate synthase [Lentimicrobiaceae bacterium]
MIDTPMYPLLDTVQFPEDIRRLPIEKLPQLCEELRHFIITQSANNPGHLGASLGTIELTVAIHYVFDTPNDKLVWDVGHQAYTHKIITGRKDRFATNRKHKGMSGFPKMCESEYDAFGTGHSSTSISAILGMATAARLAGNTSQQHIAVIGDGAMGGGMAFEAMNQAGGEQANMLVILNDNRIAIDENVGAMSQYLLRITSSKSYNRVKKGLWKFFNFSKFLTQGLSRLGNAVKGQIVSKSNLFQQLGFRYFGPADGHDVVKLVRILKNLKEIQGPKLLHIVTVKGKGLQLAEENQIAYHFPGNFDPETGELIVPDEQNMPPKFQTVFGETILELALKDGKVVGITPAMATGCSLTIMREKLPHRVFDVGIAEPHAVTFAAGLAAAGYIPFCNIYSSFLQRSYDQIIHDVALQKLPVVFCIDRAGLVGEDGPTHHGAFDLAFLRTIPNMIIAAPMNETELRNMMFTAYTEREQPFAIRYPRGKGVVVDWRTSFEKLEIGASKLLKQGKEIAVLSLGPLGNHVTQAIDMLEKEGINPTHVDVRFLKPFDKKMLDEICNTHRTIITVEDGTVTGGFFSEVSEYIIAKQYTTKVFPIALPNTFIEHGDITNLYKSVGFDVESIANCIRQNFKL